MVETPCCHHRRNAQRLHNAEPAPPQPDKNTRTSTLPMPRMLPLGQAVFPTLAGAGRQCCTPAPSGTSRLCLLRRLPARSLFKDHRRRCGGLRTQLSTDQGNNDTMHGVRWRRSMATQRRCPWAKMDLVGDLCFACALPRCRTLECTKVNGRSETCVASATGAEPRSTQSCCTGHSPHFCMISCLSLLPQQLSPQPSKRAIAPSSQHPSPVPPRPF